MKIKGRGRQKTNHSLNFDKFLGTRDLLDFVINLPYGDIILEKFHSGRIVGFRFFKMLFITTSL